MIKTYFLKMLQKLEHLKVKAQQKLLFLGNSCFFSHSKRMHGRLKIHCGQIEIIVFEL